jgi:septin family protein
MFSITIAYAQEVMEAKTEFQKTTQPSVMVELPYSPDVVEDAIKDYFNRIGVKPDGARGFQVYRSTRLGLTDAWNSDLYFKVEKKSRKEKEESVVYFFATPEKQQPNLRKPGDYYGVDGARVFMKNMLPSIDTYNLQVQISMQQEEVKKAEKKYQRIVEDGDDLDKKLKKVQENIQENKNDLARQKLEIENQRKLLEMLKAKKR